MTQIKAFRLPLALMSLGIGLLVLHLLWLNSLLPTNSYEYFGAQPKDDVFAARLLSTKILFKAFWLMLCACGIAWSRSCLRQKYGRSIHPFVMFRLLLASVLFCASVVPLINPDIHFRGAPATELFIYFSINSLAYACIAAALALLPEAGAVYHDLGRGFIRVLKLPGYCFCLLAFSSITFFAYKISGAFFHFIPLVDDTIAMVVHSHFLMEGHLFGNSPPLPQFFPFKMMVNDGNWYSQYGLGHVALLAIGGLFGHVELTNPVLGGLEGVAIYLLAKEIYGVHVAKIAALLASVCAYMIVFSSEYMNSATSLLALTLFLYGFIRVIKRWQPRDVVLSGVALGYCFLTRPYSALVFAIPAALYAAYLCARQWQWRGRLLPMVVLALITLNFVGFQLYYNTLTTGNPYRFPYQKANGEVHNPFTPKAISKLDAEQFEQNWCRNEDRTVLFNWLLFAWPVPALSLVALLYIWHGQRRDERLLYTTVLCAFISCLFFPGYEDWGWGPRLVYEVTGILVVLSAKALSLIPAFLRMMSQRRHALSAYYGFAIVLWLTFVPFALMYNLTKDTLMTAYWFKERQNNFAYLQGISTRVTKPALVFVPLERYKFVSVVNPPTFGKPLIFAADLQSDNFLLTRLYPGYRYYKIEVKNGFQRLVPISIWGQPW